MAPKCVYTFKTSQAKRQHILKKKILIHFLPFEKYGRHSVSVIEACGVPKMQLKYFPHPL